MKNLIIFLILGIAFCNAEEVFLKYNQLPVKQEIVTTVKIDWPDFDLHKQISEKLELSVQMKLIDLSLQLKSFTQSERLREGKRSIEFFKKYPLNIQLTENSLTLSSEKKSDEELIDLLEDMPTLIGFTDYGLFSYLYSHIALMGDQPLHVGDRFSWSVESDIDGSTPITYFGKSQEEEWWEYTITAISEKAIEAHIVHYVELELEEEDLSVKDLEGTIVWNRQNALLFQMQLHMIDESEEGDLMETHFSVVSK